MSVLTRSVLAAIVVALLVPLVALARRQSATTGS